MLPYIHRSHLSLSVLMLWMLTMCIFVNNVKASSRQPSICLSPFKSEEELASLQEKMLRSHNRFGNFDSESRNCIRTQVRNVYKDVLPSECISSSVLEDAVLDAFGHCIDGIVEVRNRLTRLAKTGRLSTIPSVGRKGCNSTLLVVDTVSRTDDAPTVSNLLATPPISQTLPYASPLRKIARFIGLEPKVSYYGYQSYGCSSGLHWCCVYVSETINTGCFRRWCPHVDVKCN